jgi:elongation factor Tu
MAKELNIALIGHVDHGKSSLLAAMSSSFSKVGLTTFVPYEQIDLAASGSSQPELKLNRAELKITGKTRDYRLFDFPSHQDFIKSLITTSSIDGILLVVSAADGTMPQTREHLHLARETGAENLVFVLNKADMVSASLQDMVESEVRGLLEEKGFFTKSCPVIKGSALLARNCGCGDKNCPKCGFLFAILETLEKCVKEPASDSEKPLFFTVDDAFETPFGLTLAKGTVLKGSIKKDDKVRIVLGDKQTELTVKAIEAEGTPLEKVEAVSSASLYLEGIKAEPAVNGSFITALKGSELRKEFRALVYIFRKEENGRETPFKSGHKSEFCFWGRKAEGIFKLPPDREMVMPGDSSMVWIKLASQFFIEKGFTFSIAENGKNIGIGKIVEVME